MGNVSHQSNEARENQILLLGIRNQGKTRFLYEYLLKGSYKGVINQTLGYNYEVVQVNQDSFGIWDLAGSRDFRVLWKHFYNNIQFMAFFVIVRITTDSKETSKNLIKTRKLIEEIIGKEQFQNKLFVLLINVPDSMIFGEQKHGYIKESEKHMRRKEVSTEVKQLLQWKEINHQPKWDYALDIGDPYTGVDNFWVDFQQKYNELKS